MRPRTISSEERSKAFQPAGLLATYERQRQQGVQEKLARFDRNKRLAGAQADLAKAVSDSPAS